MRPGARRLELWRQLLVRGLVLVALGALALSGDAGAWGATLGMLGVGVGWTLRGRPAQVEAWNVLTALVAVGCLLAPSLLNLPWSWMGVTLLVYLQVHRARVGEGTDDDRLALLFALLMVLLSATSTRSGWMAVVMLALITGLPVVLTLLRLRELEDAHAARHHPLGGDGRARLLIAMAPASLLLTAFFFAVIPRLNAEALASLATPQVMPGYDDGQVELGLLGEVKDNPELVMRATVTDAQGRTLRGPFYFRGTALDRFDGRRWWASDAALRVGMQRLPPAVDPGRARPGELRQELLVEALADAPVFAIPTATRVVVDEPLRRGVLGAWRLSGDPRPRRVVVLSDPNAGGAAAASAARGLLPTASMTGLPADLDPRILELAERLTEGADTPQAKARAIVDALRSGYRYTLIPPPALARQPLSAFLFESREGHCEYFATALAVLLRASGVPAVLALGFYGGDWNEVGGYLVIRQTHAHAWVEAELGPGQWVRLDATPAGEYADDPGGAVGQLADLLRSRWGSWVIDYDLDQQIGGVRSLQLALAPTASPSGPAPGLPGFAPLLLVLFAPLIAVGAGVRGFRRWALGPRTRPPPASPVARIHARARRLVARRGWAIPPSLPPVEAARWLAGEAGEAARPLEALAWIHYRSRYADARDPDALAQAKACLAALKRLPSRSRT